MNIYLLILLLISAPLVSADNLQRLFTTVQERMELEVNRNKSKSEPVEQKAPSYITMNGLIIRSNKVTTVWVNDSNETYQEGFTVQLDGVNELKTPIFLSDSEQVILLKPGQTVNVLDGQIIDNFKKKPMQKIP
ncbi:hypothetical protein QUF50_09265 [Thiotrichales bacterium HSG1]|nr:hypothetical protein [Thiotrichales bacterium HSG1]